MALRDQPYLPLYVQDYLSDEKLSCCTLSSQGVYIRILCVLHKSETYGGILFKQIPKQNFSSIQYFAFIISKQIGCTLQEVADALEELLFFQVLKIRQVENIDYLYQKRMEKDFDVSLKRSFSAKKGGGNPKLKKNLFKQTPKQTYKQNPEYEIENDNEYENDNNGKESVREKPKKFTIPTIQEISNYCLERKNTVDPQNFFDFYQSKGWKIGKNQMKDWKASVRTWEKNSNTKKTENDGSGKQITSKQQFRFSSSDAISSITRQTE